MLQKNDLLKIKKPILITGETGSGKNHLARWVNHNSNAKNFVQVNISSISSNLFESELFGHVKGSFTGAVREKTGFVEEARGGILFLDEIAELDLALQAKLLTLIDEGIYYKVGSSIKCKFHGRFIFATNKNLANLVEQGEFREDLYHRIKYFKYELEPLRKKVDKHKIIEDIFSKYKLLNQNFSCHLDHSSRNYVLNYSWPGNFRELSEFFNYLTTVKTGVIKISDLAPINSRNCEEFELLEDCFYSALHKFEKKFLLKKLLKYSGAINKTAKNINISKVTLLSKIKKYKIDIPRIKLEALQKKYNVLHVS